MSSSNKNLANLTLEDKNLSNFVMGAAIGVIFVDF